jgi:hypothetical protein
MENKPSYLRQPWSLVLLKWKDLLSSIILLTQTCKSTFFFITDRFRKQDPNWWKTRLRNKEIFHAKQKFWIICGPRGIPNNVVILNRTLNYSTLRFSCKKTLQISKAHKLLQVCKQVVTNLFTSCWQVVFALLVPSCCNKLLTTCKTLDGIIRLVRRLF